MEIRFPMWLRVVGRPGAREFAILSAVEAFSRAVIAGVIPLQAHDLLVEARTISLVYAGVGVVAFATSFMVPLVLLRLRRKWIFSAGTLCMVAAPLLMLLSEALPFVTALQVRALAVVCVNIALNLYILDYIRRKDFVASEPKRLAFLGISWFIGPALGIFLYQHYGLLPVCLLSAGFALAALCYFWYLRIVDNPTVAPARGAPPMPWRNIRRYLAQPRLRLAWIIPFGRSTFWTTFFVYPPLYIVQQGGDEAIVAVMLSAGQGLLFLAPAIGRLGARHGIRRVIIAAASGTGVISVAAGLLQPGPLSLAAIFVIAAFGAAALDALGNIPFLRAVHHYERSEMTSVFRTYIEASQLLPAAAYAAVLTVAPLPAVFMVLGLVLLVSAWYARYLPKAL
ncbi:MAG: MFS transporter [Kiloniellaceae bacterium]